MSGAKIVIVEAQGSIHDRFGRSLERQGHQTEYLAPEGDVARRIASRRCDMVLAAEGMTSIGTAELMFRLQENRVAVPILIIASEGSVRHSIEAIRAGAADVVLLSDDEVKLNETIENILEKKIKKESKPTASEMVAGAENMQRLLEMVKRIAPSSATVLIQGESGTGKEVMARYIHRSSGRSDHPFIAMNCAALPDNLAESELFGYEKGAFTGAIARKRGRFEQAQGGTLLLDEISEMPLALQAKLLRVLQEKEVDRIGGSGTVPVDVRIIATTNRDLSQMVKEGLFRKDLYYRLRIIPLTIPPLRERSKDIPRFIEHFLIKYGSSNESGEIRFDGDAMETLTQWGWPGNVRELENTIERAMLLRNGDLMGPELLLLEEDLSTGPVASTARLVGMTVKELEERLILQTLNHVDQNRTHAAEMLGISIRTLRNKLKEYREDDVSCDVGGRG